MTQVDYKNFVTWGLLVWIGAQLWRDAAGEPPSIAEQAQRGLCSYGPFPQQQSNVVAPFWIRHMCEPAKPFIFESE